MSKVPQTPQQVQVPSFNDLARQLDPMLPAVDYDALREKYFKDHILPNIENPTAVPKLYEDFKSKTERQSTLTSTERLLLRGGLFAASATKAMIAPATVIPKVKELYDTVVSNEADMEKIAAREGIDSNITRGAGNLVGSGIDLAALLPLAGPIAGGIAESAFTSARTIGLASRALRGGLAFATYEAGADQQGDRLLAGAKGFAWGAGGDLLLGLPAFLKAKGVVATMEEASSVSSDIMQGKEVKPEVNQAAADYLKNTELSSRKEGRPNLFLDPNSKRKGVHAIMETQDGHTIAYEIKTGNEDSALNNINKVLDKGGALDTLQWHPDEHSRAIKLLRTLADKNNLKYDENVLVRTQEAQAPEIQTKLKENDIPSEVKPNGTISVPKQDIVVPPAEKPSLAEPEFTPSEELENVKTQAEATVKGTERKLMGEKPKMTLDEASALVTKLGRDPAKADLEAISHMGEAEVNRLMETVQKTREVRVGINDSILQEQNRLGDPEARFSGGPLVRSIKGAVNSVVEALGFNPEKYKAFPVTFDDPTMPELQGSSRPGRMTIVVPNSVMSRMSDKLGGGDFNGLTYQNWQAGLKEIGADIDAKVPNSPLLVVREGVGKETLYHEGIHANFTNAEMNPIQFIPPKMRGVFTELANGIAGHEGYKGLGFPSLVDEAFTWTAQAIRFNDQSLLNELASYDRSVEHLYQMMNETSENMLKSSIEKLDNPGVRILQRRLGDLIRRTSESPFAGQARFEVDGSTLNFEPTSGSWSLEGGTPGQFTKFASLHDLWSHIMANDVSDYTSDPTFWAQSRGVRGALVPPKAGGPGKNLPLPEFPMVGKGFGWSSVSGWFRPFMPWVASLDRKLQVVAATKGVKFPLFDRVRAVDDAVRAGDQFLSHYTEKFGDVLANFSHDKQRTLFELLSYKDDMWEKAANKLNLDPKELQQASKLVSVAKEFEQDTHIPIMTYLQEFYPRLKANAWQTDSVPGWGLLKNPKSMGFWEKAISTDELDPSDNHAGKFLKWVIKAGWEKKFTGRPLDELSKLVDLKTPDGAYVLGTARWPLTNYVKYMKGVPDVTSQVINKVVGDFQGALSSRFKEMNKFLPEGAKLPEEFSAPGQALNKLMLLSYAGGLALRPAVTIRDALQVFITGMPIIGPTSFAKGIGKALTREGWDFAERSGALLRKTNIGEMYGDVFQEAGLPEKGSMAAISKFSQKLLGPSRWGNNLARSIVFNGVFDDALSALGDFKNGKIDQGKFLQDSHLWFTDDQVYSKFLARAAGGEAHGNLAKDIALELVDNTQWAYRRGTQPAMLRTGLGRLFGQYGNWPLNYAEFVTKLGRKYSTFPGQSSRGVASWLAVNGVAATLMEAAGADSSKWLWTSPASFTGGPQLELVKDLMQGMETTDQGASARARVLRYPLNFIPGSIAMRSWITALEGQEDLSVGGKGFMRMMGFKPLNDVENDKDYSEWLLEESGLTANPYKR